MRKKISSAILQTAAVVVCGETVRAARILLTARTEDHAPREKSLPSRAEDHTSRDIVSRGCDAAEQGHARAACDIQRHKIIGK